MTGTAFKAGKYKATSRGFLFDRIHNEGATVEVSQQYIDEHKAKTGRDFKASWLELKVEAKPEIKAAPKSSK